MNYSSLWVIHVKTSPQDNPCSQCVKKNIECVYEATIVKRGRQNRTRINQKSYEADRAYIGSTARVQPFPTSAPRSDKRKDPEAPFVHSHLNFRIDHPTLRDSGLYIRNFFLTTNVSYAIYGGFPLYFNCFPFDVNKALTDSVPGAAFISEKYRQLVQLYFQLLHFQFYSIQYLGSSSLGHTQIADTCFQVASQYFFFLSMQVSNIDILNFGNHTRNHHDNGFNMMTAISLHEILHSLVSKDEMVQGLSEVNFVEEKLHDLISEFTNELFQAQFQIRQANDVLQFYCLLEWLRGLQLLYLSEKYLQQTSPPTQTNITLVQSQISSIITSPMFARTIIDPRSPLHFLFHATDPPLQDPVNTDRISNLWGTISNFKIQLDTQSIYVMHTHKDSSDDQPANTVFTQCALCPPISEEECHPHFFTFSLSPSDFGFMPDMSHTNNSLVVFLTSLAAEELFVAVRRLLPNSPFTHPLTHTQLPTFSLSPQQLQTLSFNKRLPFLVQINALFTALHIHFNHTTMLPPMMPQPVPSNEQQKTPTEVNEFCSATFPRLKELLLAAGSADEIENVPSVLSFNVALMSPELHLDNATRPAFNTLASANIAVLMTSLMPAAHSASSPLAAATLETTFSAAESVSDFIDLMLIYLQNLQTLSSSAIALPVAFRPSQLQISIGPANLLHHAIFHHFRALAHSATQQPTECIEAVLLSTRFLSAFVAKQGVAAVTSHPLGMSLMSTLLLLLFSLFSTNIHFGGRPSRHGQPHFHFRARGRSKMVWKRSVHQSQEKKEARNVEEEMRDDRRRGRRHEDDSRPPPLLSPTVLSTLPPETQLACLDSLFFVSLCTAILPSPPFQLVFYIRHVHVLSRLLRREIDRIEASAVVQADEERPANSGVHDHKFVPHQFSEAWAELVPTLAGLLIASPVHAEHTKTFAVVVGAVENSEGWSMMFQPPWKRQQMADKAKAEETKNLPRSTIPEPQQLTNRDVIKPELTLLDRTLFLPRGRPRDAPKPEKKEQATTSLAPLSLPDDSVIQKQKRDDSVGSISVTDIKTMRVSSFPNTLGGFPRIDPIRHSTSTVPSVLPPLKPLPPLPQPSPYVHPYNPTPALLHPPPTPAADPPPFAFRPMSPLSSQETSLFSSPSPFDDFSFDLEQNGSLSPLPFSFFDQMNNSGSFPFYSGSSFDSAPTGFFD
ncbi:hypothetical protein BLNAU_20233 [Blattamonas nauphoetae]|uniref:Uncharacterized protein n=1 Tax=Blattamonas nauphoetae TaxID=2049346 RepID=A0ABQ9WZ85_9EUKA|nr:hypothetical protein BLNAU_20233 [Blattamonas nauphoetae]